MNNKSTQYKRSSWIPTKNNSPNNKEVHHVTANDNPEAEEEPNPGHEILELEEFPPMNSFSVLPPHASCWSGYHLLIKTLVRILNLIKVSAWETESMIQQQLGCWE